MDRYTPRSPVILTVCALSAMALSLHAGQPDAAGQILGEAGVAGGLVVHLGCGDGRLTAALHASDRYLVQGLDTDPKQVAAARKRIASAGLWGQVSVDVFDGTHLPYVDNLVNLLVAESLGDVAVSEVTRVLAPRGVALIGGKKTVKPWPADIDEWTHFLHDASGNAVAKDARVGSPRRVQWMAGPKRCRDHDGLSSLSAMTSSAGRLFYIFDEGHTSLMHRPAAWKLTARDAFNGVLLWKRDIPKWVPHLFYFRSGPAHVPRRLVSVADRVYVTLGLEAPVSVLDAATGRTLRVLEGSEKTEEIVCHRGTVLAVVGDATIFDDEAPKVYGYWELSVKRKPTVQKAIAAYDAATGKPLWRKTGASLAWLAPLSLVALGEKAFFLDNEHLHCVRLQDGRELWQAPFPTEGLFLRNYAPTVVAADGVVMCLSWDRLHAFAAEDGRKLWEHKGAMGFASPADLFAIRGLAWTNPHTASIWNGSRLGKNGKRTTGIPIPRTSFLGNNASEIWGVDIQTGEVKRTLPRAKVLPGGHHARCYRNKATEDYLICSRRGLEYIDLDGDHHVNNWWVRGVCQYGVMPANGLTYAPPDPCQCFNHIKLNGFCALAAGSSLDDLTPASDYATEKGPAYASVQAKPPAKGPPPAPAAKGLAWHPPVYPTRSDEWPTYRGNITRSGSTPTRVPEAIEVLWKARIGGGPTASVAADGRLVVCSKDTHTVHCLSAATGKPLWRFAAGGRVDSPPTLADGLCVFGCADGSVSCLRASDGELAWRFRAAAVDRRTVTNSRLESVWPIHGSVLVLDGVAYFAAGRSSYLDGGIHLFGLDVRSGKKLHDTWISTAPEALGRRGPPGEGALVDLLVSDGVGLNMRHLRFDASLEGPSRGRLGTLFSSTGLLEGTWAHRQPWRLGRGGKGSTASKSKLLVFDAASAYGVMNPYTWLKRTSAMWPASHEGHFHQKYSRYKAADFPMGVRIAATRNGTPRGPSRDKRRGKEAKATPAADIWAVDAPTQPRAMVLAADRLFLAGWRDGVVIEERTGRPLDPHSPDPRPAFLWILSTADGHTIAEHGLPCEPVFDGLSAAYGRLFLSLKDGSVVCMGAPK